MIDFTFTEEQEMFRKAAREFAETTVAPKIPELEETGKFGSTVPQSAKEGRYDLRDLDLVTIDGADARDFDDAVWCTRRRGGWRLLVAIADVSWYVTPGSALDAEARSRGNSVYFPERVIPMLPEALSNGLIHRWLAT